MHEGDIIESTDIFHRAVGTPGARRGCGSYWAGRLFVRMGNNGDGARHSNRPTDGVHRPTVMKHIGVCTINGPVEKSGEIQFRRTGFLSSWIEGRLTFADEQCTFRVRDGTTHEGVMECPGTRGVPLSLKVE